MKEINELIPDERFKYCKIKVNSPEHSRAIQKRLFELGYSWSNTSNEYIKLEKPYLYTRNSLISWISNAEYFKRDISKEITLNDLYKEPEEIKINDTIIVSRDGANISA